MQKYALYAINLLELSVYLDNGFCESLRGIYAVKSPFAVDRFFPFSAIMQLVQAFKNKGEGIVCAKLKSAG